jgi:hypothetical protein
VLSLKSRWLDSFEVPRKVARIVGVTLVAAVAGASPARAQSLTVDLLFGSAFNIPTPLTISQAGFPDIRLTARYDTKPFGPYAPYYLARVGFWGADRAWEVQFLHHRLFLKNTTPEVERFEVHYGYSYLLVGPAWRWNGFVVRANGGAIITSPASRVRGRGFNTGEPDAEPAGYDVSGVGGSVAVSRDLKLSRHVSVVGNVGLLTGWASVPVAGGSASVPNVSLHGQIGLGVRF